MSTLKENFENLNTRNSYYIIEHQEKFELKIEVLASSC